jgi:hypothetical protein
MKRHLIVPALGLGAIAGLIIAASAQGAPLPTATGTNTGSPTASPSPSVSPSESPSPDPEPTGDGEVTADIHFEINYEVDAPEAPLASDITGVPVTDGVELETQDVFVPDSEGIFCTLPSVDIAADLSSVTVTGADDRCGVQVAYLKVTLHGADFGTVTLGADTLFQPIVGDGAFASGGAGNGALGQSVRFAPVQETPPRLEAFGVSGNVFEAYWVSDGHGVMTGATQFAFALDADGAEPVAGEPTFTG